MSWNFQCHIYLPGEYSYAELPSDNWFSTFFRKDSTFRWIPWLTCQCIGCLIARVMEIRKMGLIPSINHSQLIDEATLKVNSKHGVLATECLQARFWHSEYVLKKYCDNNNNKLRNIEEKIHNTSALLSEWKNSKINPLIFQFVLVLTGLLSVVYVTEGAHFLIETKQEGQLLPHHDSPLHPSKYLLFIYSSIQCTRAELASIV